MIIFKLDYLRTGAIKNRIVLNATKLIRTIHIILNNVFLFILLVDF